MEEGQSHAACHSLEAEIRGTTALHSQSNASNEAPLAQMAQMSSMPVPDFSAQRGS
jgi:hypothetical protein